MNADKDNHYVQRPRMNADKENTTSKGRGSTRMDADQNLEGARLNAGEDGLKHKELTERIIGVFYEVYNELGHGFLESVYEEAMAIALTQAGMRVERQVPLKVAFRGSVVGEFRADVLVENAVLLELKAARDIDSSHEAQLLNYLRGTRTEVGLLLNFGSRPRFKRLVFENSRKNGPRMNAD